MSQSILIADDSAAIQRSASDALRALGFEVAVVADGDSAVAALADGSTLLVVADVHMPGRDGYEVARRAKQSAIPVVLLVGTFEAFDTAAFEACGADACVRKPFGPEDLCEQVLALIEAPGEAVETPESVDLQPESDAEQAAPHDEAAEIPSQVHAALEREGVVFVDVEPPALDSGGIDLELDGEGGVGEESEPDQSPVGTAEPSVDASPASAPAASEAGGSQTGRTSGPVTPEEVVQSAAELIPGRTPGASLSSEEIEAIARRVIELGGMEILREIAWEVVPDLAEVVVRERLRELEAAIEEG